MSKTTTNLGQSLGKSIGQICPFSLGKINTQNHCAHYVSHMMSYEFPGPTCKNFTWADKQKSVIGATIRVDNIFKQCTKSDLLSAKPAAVTECLIFVTLASNVTRKATKYVMANHPKKHIGILNQGKVWNYSNTKNQVVSDLQDYFIKNLNVHISQKALLSNSIMAI
ncbi:hypothetical protein ACJJIF_13605 [Microbulbifer sp. SSSA002]|uniref:hypothetical protein n=1 Tax=Microbulbifer sp. SSSA002 TaxID=3243376 RepID=UPI0040391808